MAADSAMDDTTLQRVADSREELARKRTRAPDLKKRMEPHLPSGEFTDDLRSMLNRIREGLKNNHACSEEDRSKDSALN